MKKLRRIFSWTIWSLLALYVLTMAVIQLPAFQTWLGRQVASAIGQELGTEVSVERVNLGFLNRLIIDGVTIKDLKNKEMLHAGRLSAKIDLFPLLDGRVSISSAQLFGARLTLYRDSADATPNFQFALDALSSPDNDEPSALDLRINSLIVRQLAVSYDQLDTPLTPGRLNMRHLGLSDISAHILLKALTTDTLNLNVKRLALREQSGLELQRLSFSTEANRQSMQLTGLSIDMPHSTLQADTLTASYRLDSLAATLSLSARIADSHLALSDVAPLLPFDVPDRTLAISTQIEATPHHIALPQLNLSTDDGSLLLRAAATLDTPAGQPQGSAQIDRLFISGQLLDELSQRLPSLPAIITRLGDVDLHSTLALTTEGTIEAQGRVATGIGTLALQGTVTTDARQWDVHAETDSLSLRRLTDRDDLGLMAASLDLHATPTAVRAQGVIPRLDWHGYSYRDVQLDAFYHADGSIEGKVKIDQPELAADVEGAFDSSLGAPHVRLTGYIGSLSPKGLNLSKRWGDAHFAAVIDADFTASSLADAQGTIDLDDFIMAVGDTTQYHLDNLHVRSGWADDRRHFLRLGSDFGEIQLDGQFNWSTLPRSFAAIAPMLSDGKDVAADNDFDLSVSLTDSRWMQQLLGIDLDLEGPLRIDAHIDDTARQIDVEASVPSFSYGDDSYRSLTVQAVTQADSTIAHASVERLTASGNPLRITLDARATAQQHIITSLTLATNHSDGGTINAITQTYRNDDGVRETHVRLLPSEFVAGSMVWELEPCDILYSERRLMVDHFSMHHDDGEHLIIDGIASTRTTDTLTVDLQGLDVAYLLDLVNFSAVSFGGRATGTAQVAHAFEEPEAWADIEVDNLLFQQAPMGMLEAHALWNGADSQIDLDAVIDDGADAQTYIDGFISPARGELDLGFQAHGTNGAFIHSFTRNFMSRMEGRIDGDIRLSGSLKQLELTGQAVVDGMATITPLGTTYTFERDTIRLTPGRMAFSNFALADRDGNVALVQGAINHQHLKHITVDLHALTSQLLVYDFPVVDAGSTIGGTLWADGEVDISVRPGVTTLECDLTPSPGSVFIYNAANPDAISQQQFITWGQAPPTLAQGSGSGPHGMAIETYPADNNRQSADTPSDLYLNLRINATPDATLRLLMDQRSGDFITLQGAGALRATYYNKGAFQLFGTYNVERGTYSMTIQNIIRKNFTFQPGSTLIFGGDPLQAALSLKALHTVNGVSLSDLGLGNSFTSNTIRVNCLMNIVGTAGEPRVEFDLEMPTVNSEEEQMIRSIIASEQELNQQVVYLLGIGRFYTQGQNNAETQAYGQTELAMQSLLSGTISSQVNQLLSQVIRNEDWNFGANISTGNEGWHNAEYEGLISGRMLNNRLLLNGQFGYRDNPTQATSSFIGDFDIQYLLTPSGSLALKAYNQTNDRYFTHSSLNTQGIGIIVKRDFSGWRDFLRSRRKSK